MELIDAIKAAKRVYLIGNGGSAANAQHVANDLILCGIKAQALLDVPTITALANDFGYDEIFSRQLEIVGEPGELLIALSGSGRSVNILNALDVAVRIGMVTYAVVGAFGDCTAANYARYCIRSGENMQDAEDDQLALFHSFYRILKGFQ